MERMKTATDLQFFSTLVKSGSLTAAAREYDVTPSAVSKWLAQLEARLGARLVTRTTRRIALTNEGEVYLAEGRRILAEIDELERAVGKSRAVPTGLLKVNASLGFGRSLIAPAVSAFARKYPELEIRLVLTDRPLSLTQGDADIGIRFGPPADARLVARRIAKHRRRVVASPQYLKRHGRPLVPHDLLRHNCIVVRQDEAAYGQWHFSKGDRSETVRVRGTLSSNDGTTALLWALDGHGVLMRSEWDSTPYVRRGRLEVLLDDYDLPPADLYAVYPPKRHLAAKVAVFVDFLTARFSDGTVLGTMP
jgi:DNA-binding transcriptional LysR family regulator